MDSPIFEPKYNTFSDTDTDTTSSSLSEKENTFKMDLEHRNSSLLNPIKSDSESDSDSDIESELNDNLIYEMKKSNINRISTEDKINFFLKNLTPYEKEEIIKEFSFENVYYIGNINNKNNLDIHYQTHCYDDLIFNYENSDRFEIIQYNHLNYRYQIEIQLGKGSYGNVVKCIDHKYNQKVAVKIYKNDIRFRKSNINEINILKLIKDNYSDDTPYVLIIKDYFVFRHHYCMVSNIYGVNLYENRHQTKYFTYREKLKIILDIFNGAEFLKNGIPEYSIIHGDLKPENIIMKYSCSKPDVIIVDFGLSKKIKKGSIINNNFIIQSRHYRAPEIYYNIPYDESTDIWSIGCIIYELFLDEVLFPARDDKDLLIFIHQIIGVPDHKYIKKNMRILKYYRNYSPKYTQDTKYVVREPLSDPKLKIESLKQKYNPHYIYTFRLIDAEKNEELIDKQIVSIQSLIHGCLKYESSERITPIEGIQFINNIIENRK